MCEEILDRVQLGPSGVPIAYGMDGQPLTTREAAELFGDLDRRTLNWTPVILPSGTIGIVRTLCLVFDDEAATDMVPESHVPQVFASALYTASPENRVISALWTYGSPAEAHAGHAEAVNEFASGRADVTA